MVRMKKAELTLLLLVVLVSIQPLVNNDVETRVQSLNLGFFKPVLTLNHSSKPSCLMNANSAIGPVTGFYTDVDVTIIVNDQYRKLSSVGSKTVYIVNDYSIVTGTALGFDAHVVDLKAVDAVNSFNMDLNVRYIKPIGALFVDNTTNIFYYAEAVNGAKQIIQLNYDFSKNEFKFSNRITLYVTLNIAYGYTNAESNPRFVVLNNGVNLIESQGLVHLEVGGLTEIVEASLRDFQGLYVRGDTILLVFKRERDLVIISYSGETIRKETFQHDGRAFVIPALNHMLLALETDTGLKLSYIDPETLGILKEKNVEGGVFSVLDVDLDGDGFNEIIVLDKHQYVVETSSGERAPIYWTKLREPVCLSTNTVTYNDETYMLAIHRDGGLYEVEVLKLDEETDVDNTPPTITITEPTDGEVYRNVVKIALEVVDEESGVYLSIIRLTRGGTVVYYKRVGGTVFEDFLNLTPGLYSLVAESWNTFGFSNSLQTVFYVVDNDILVLSPVNYSVVSSNVNISVASYGEYNLSIYLNNSLYTTLKLKPGLNNIVLTLNTEGTLYVELRVEETCRTHVLILTVDLTKPEIHVYGLFNETAYSNVIVFYVYVFDEHLLHAGVDVSGCNVFTTRNNGNFTIVYNTLRLPDGVHVIEVYAEDLAGNYNGIAYTVSIINPIEFELTIEPLINESFVSGSVELRLLSNSPEAHAYVNGNLLQVICNEWGVNATLLINTESYVDGVYTVAFKSIFKGSFIERKLIWFIDNNPPAVDLRLPVVIRYTSWVNGSYAPVFNPEINYSYLRIVNGSFFYVVYVKGVDRWIDEVRLTINDTVTSVLTDGYETLSIFRGNVSKVAYVKVPGSGLYYLRAEARDLSGKSSSLIIKVIFDFDKPWLNVLEPKNGTVTNLDSIRFTLKTFDETSRLCALGLSVLVNQSTRPPLTSYYPLPNRTVSICGSQVSFEIGFKHEATHYIWFIAIDQSYNYYETYVKLVIDRTAPRVSYSYAVNGSLMDIYVEVEDENGVNNVSIYLNDRVAYTTGEARFNATVSLQPGLNVVKIVATDLAGNIAFKVVEVDVNVTPVESTLTIKNGERRGAGSSLSHLALALTIVSTTLVFVASILIKWRRKTRCSLNKG